MAGVKRKFTHRHTLRGMEIGIFHIACMPACLGKQLVAMDTYAGFRRHACKTIIIFNIKFIIDTNWGKQKCVFVRPTLRVVVHYPQRVCFAALAVL